MEEGVFRDPAVAGTLEERYVEARLHTDHPERGDEQTELQLAMTQSLAQPIYVVIDPRSEERHGRVDGALRDKFVTLLDTAWQSARGDKHAASR